MKFNKHLKEHDYPNFELLCILLDLENENNLHEGVSDKTFDTLKKAATKLGLRLKRSDSIFDYLKGMAFLVVCIRYSNYNPSDPDMSGPPPLGKRRS